MTKREMILQAGQHLFSQYGPRKTTVDDIVDRAHVARGTFYKYFSDKGDLFLGVAEIEADKFLDSLQTAITRAGTTREKIRAYLATAAEKARKFEKFTDVNEDTFPDLTSKLVAMRDRILDRERQMLYATLQEGVRRGELTISNLDRASDALLIGIGIHRVDKIWVFERFHVPFDQVINELLDMLFNGIGARYQG